MKPYLTVPGTWSRGESGQPQWWEAGSPFTRFMASQGWWLLTLDHAIWTGDLEGGPMERYLLFRWIDRGGWHRDWRHGGEVLAHALLAHVERGTATVIAHSHGLQVVLYALADHPDVEIPALVSVGSPVREDMRAVAAGARPRIGRWLHRHADWSDRWQWLGASGDGLLRIRRRHPLADRNDGVRGVGHSRLLSDPTAYHYWIERGWTACGLKNKPDGARDSSRSP